MLGYEGKQEDSPTSEQKIVKPLRRQVPRGIQVQLQKAPVLTAPSGDVALSSILECLLRHWPNSPGGSGKPWRTWLESPPRSTRACSGPPSPMGSTTPSSRRLRRHPK